MRKTQPLDNVFDEHWIYFDQIQHTTFNILTRFRLQGSITECSIQSALNHLHQKHPYLNAQVEKQPNGEGFQLVYNPSTPLKYRLIESTEDALNTLMNTRSPMLKKRMNLYAGELFFLTIWQANDQWVLECCIPHFLADTLGLLTLSSDLLDYLDNPANTNEISPQERYSYHQLTADWPIDERPITPLSLDPSEAIPNPDWKTTSIAYQRKIFPKNTLQQLKDLLVANKMQAKEMDFFYYILEQMYNKHFQQKMPLSCVFSYRSLLNKQHQNAINNLIVFSLIDVDKQQFPTPADWMDDFAFQRHSIVCKQGAMEIAYYLKNLNHTLKHSSKDEAQPLLNQLISYQVSMINNLGNLDTYFSPSNFKILDIDIQDAVPAQEIRTFSYQGERHFNLSLPHTHKLLSTEQFWQLFMKEVNYLLGND